MKRSPLTSKFAQLCCHIFTQQFPLCPPCSATQSKVRDLEEKCRIQSEQFGLLSQELEKFRLQASKVDLAGSSLLNNPSFSVLTNGVGLTTERGELCYFVLDAVSHWFCLYYLPLLIGNSMDCASAQQHHWCFFEIVFTGAQPPNRNSYCLCFIPSCLEIPWFSCNSGLILGHYNTEELRCSSSHCLGNTISA